MTSRNKVEANRQVFALLDRYSFSIKGSTTDDVGGRWIKSSAGSDRDRLVKAEVTASLSISPSLKIARFDIDGLALFCSSGLKFATAIPGLIEEEIGGGMLTAFLSELSPSPIASVLEVKNITETGSSTAGYTGHEVYEISPLFPEFSVLSGADISPEENFRVFFLMCLADTARSSSWMDGQLKTILQLIAELSPVAIPYRLLCRALFDTDPAAVFLALYRSLEALYAYSHATELISKLNIAHDWGHVAQALEETLAWRPREEPSLGMLLRYAVKKDLLLLIDSLGEEMPTSSDLVNFATKKMYNLRNSLVHYRAFHQSFDPDKINWNRLCEASALMVLHVYDSVVTH
ncbi:hypothetical protein [Pseudomonas syringae]|uniref:hypothetical protein n=1 Tax=Pseudomonas syringae TaxID=317 RepID=UPI0003460D75|nr:hypothetical protein [Pseudomonas syringae]